MAPLLGLLDTISGMITSFSVFNTEPGQAAAITGGVGEALIATVFGLCMAILSRVVHCIFYAASRSYYQRYGTMFFCA